MTLQALHRGRAPIILKSDGFRLACFGLLVANLAYLAALLLATDWIVGPNGQPIHTDFTSVYAAGRLVLAGHPVADAAKTVEVISGRLRYSEAQQGEILDHFIKGGDLTAGGIMHAVTSAAQVQASGDDAWDLEASALEALALAASR